MVEKFFRNFIAQGATPQKGVIMKRGGGALRSNCRGEGEDEELIQHSFAASEFAKIVAFRDLVVKNSSSLGSTQTQLLHRPYETKRRVNCSKMSPEGRISWHLLK